MVRLKSNSLKRLLYENSSKAEDEDEDEEELVVGKRTVSDSFQLTCKHHPMLE
jgi:hypothetical protein